MAAIIPPAARPRLRRKKVPSSNARRQILLSFRDAASEPCFAAPPPLSPGRSDARCTGMTDWKHDGVRVIPAGSLDTNTAQTPGMNRAAAINFARVGAQKLWAGTVTIHAHAKTGAHHHGHLESVIYVVKGRARMRWGDQLQFTAEAGPGDFIYVPPYVPHQEINASETEPLECVLVRSDNEAIAINIDIAPVEKPEEVYWVDPTHPHPHKH
jgi:uncharacterized RmlC-like cupin family protein